MEFDKSRVYTAVNAHELHKGDKVIVADTLNTLRQRVQKADRIWAIKQINPDDCQYRFESNDRISSLAYLVERSENCTNCVENGRVHGCTPMDDDLLTRCWNYKPITKQKVDMPELTSLGNGQYVERKNTDYNHCEEAKKACVMTNACPVKHYRPFKNTYELITAWEKKVPCNGRRPTNTMPLIWVQSKDKFKSIDLITGFDTFIVSIGIDDNSLGDLLRDYTFLDGSPCGVEE